MKLKKIQHYPLEDKLFVYMLFFSIVISIISIIGNIYIGLKFSVNYKWIILLLISLVAIKCMLKRRYITYFRFLIFFIIVFVFLPNGWITTGGSNGLTIAYSCLICVNICFLLNGKSRIFFILSEVSIVGSLIFIEIRFPYLIDNNYLNKVLLDMLIQIPLTLFTVSYIVILFANAYNQERKKLEDYSQLLKENNLKLKKLSLTDELTGIYNRRYIFERLEELKTMIKQGKVVVTIIMIDIDDFKYINDNYGHAVGDNLLKKISNSISNIVNGMGFVGRYGGDEFLAILEDSTVEKGKEIVKKIQNALDDVFLSQKIRVTVSGGMAQFTEKDNIDDVLANADKLLYKVKNNNKNNILYE